MFVAAIKSLGLGVALKIDDGSGRASEAAMATILTKLLAIDEADPAWAEMANLAKPTIRNWVGTSVGEIRPAEALAALMTN